jgi:hypothetical protein
MLRLIDPKDLSFEWERVRAGLAEVKKHTSDDWLPEDVYMSVRQGHAALYVGEDDHGDYLGFLVMRLTNGFHSSSLEIWCAYAATKRPLMARFFPEIQKIAKQAGAGRITFLSAREEWLVAGRRLGFKPVQMKYECNI